MTRLWALPDIVPIEVWFAQERDVDPVHIEGQPGDLRLGPWRPEVKIRMVDLATDAIVRFEVKPDYTCEGEVEPAVLTDDDQQRLRYLRSNIDKLIGAPDYVGATTAARILGMHKSNLKRVRDRLASIPVDGGHPVYRRADVEALAAALAADPLPPVQSPVLSEDQRGLLIELLEEDDWLPAGRGEWATARALERRSLLERAPRDGRPVSEVPFVLTELGRIAAEALRAERDR